MVESAPQTAAVSYDLAPLPLLQYLWDVNELFKPRPRLLKQYIVKLSGLMTTQVTPVTALHIVIPLNLVTK